MYLIKLFLFFSFLYTPNNKVHEYYTSITEINFSVERSKVEVSVEIIAHDLSYLFKKENLGNLKSNIENESEYFENDLIESYIVNHLKIFSKQKNIILLYLGNEISLDGKLIIYLEAKMKKPIYEIEIFNDLLVSSFPNQQNIVNLKGTINNSFTFSKYETKHHFKN
tara:strand:- start:3060 stop:3560 length:501 start_codon:yes stop_codon:yes gene_type:complete